MNLVSDPLLANLCRLRGDFFDLCKAWRDFWDKYSQDVPCDSEWATFQAAFKTAAESLLRCQQYAHESKDVVPLLPAQLPAIWLGVNDSRGLLDQFARSFSVWIAEIANGEPFTQWNLRTGFDQWITRFDELFLRPLQELIHTYEVHLATSEAFDLSAALNMSPAAPAIAQPSATIVHDADVVQPRPDFCFRRDGDGWFIRAFGKEGHFKNLKGFEYIAKLLACAGKLVPMAELAGEESVARRRVKSDEVADTDGLTVSWRPTRHLVLDEKTLKDVKRKMNELKEEIEEAERHKDVVRAELLRGEFEALAEQFQKDTRYGGESRDFGSDIDSLRQSIRKAINYACEKLQKRGMAETANHFLSSISSDGNAYVYRPPLPVVWDVQES